MKWLKSGFIFVVILSSIWAAPLPAADEDDSSRLPKTSIPLSYDITLWTNVHSGAREFNGKVSIIIDVLEETDKITLHNHGLVVQSENVKLVAYNSEEDGDEFTIETSEDTSKDFFHITTASKIEIGRYRIEISYKGQLGLDMNGFYRSSYRTSEGVTR
jgi:aminopeptidase N